MLRNDGVYPKHLPIRLVLHLQIVAYTLWLKILNFGSRSSITGETEVDVSITTYGVRTRRVWRTLETIGRGTSLPRSVVLWHEDAAVVRNPPPQLRRLTKRGLQIRHCLDYGPHKKYYPHVLHGDLDCPLVTADDDVLYPRSWLAGMVEVYRPDQVAAYRAHIMSDGPYSTWPLCEGTTPSENILATGVSGVIYPPDVLMALRSRQDAFLQVCPRADDFWLHYAAVATGVMIRQVSDSAATWWPTRPRQPGLWCSNVVDNDAVVKPVRDMWMRPSASS